MTSCCHTTSDAATTCVSDVDVEILVPAVDNTSPDAASVDVLMFITEGTVDPEEKARSAINAWLLPTVCADNEDVAVTDASVGVISAFSCASMRRVLFSSALVTEVGAGCPVSSDKLANCSTPFNDLLFARGTSISAIAASLLCEPSSTTSVTDVVVTPGVALVVMTHEPPRSSSVASDMS